MDTMFILILCLMVACSQAGLNDISGRQLRDMLEDEEFVDHASRVVQAADAAGYEVAALYGESLETGEHRRVSAILLLKRYSLTKRDIEAHVAHPSTESRNFQLRLTSGERLHMSLTKRSVLAPDLTVVERLQNGTGKSRPQVRDCFFSGSLESGHASLSLCDGKVTGAIHSKDRDIQLHPLPEDVAWNHHDEGDPPLLMLLTWSNVTDDEPPSPADFIEVQENDTKYNSKKPKGKRSVKDKNMTIEVGVYLDRLFIKKVQESLGISSNQELTELIAAKWSGISGVLNSPSMRQYGWNINIKIVSLEIWRKNPGNRCNETKGTGIPKDNLRTEVALRYHQGTGRQFVFEIHELGHSLGLMHDYQMPQCSGQKKGFMANVQSVLSPCYAKTLDSLFRIMPPKLQLDKAAWQWVTDVVDPQEVTKSHVDIAYRCNLKPCPKGECKRNCRGNPFCLNALGEKRWFEDLDESRWNDFDPESERRPEGHFVGLKNLGATCYVNTFLQLMFHNASVRNALYQWRDPDMPSDPDADWKPTSICGHLQLIFGLLKYSKRLYIDPTPLIEALGLDTHEQQDAQEFSKLFLTVLEGALSSELLGPGTNIIQEQFSGIYCYITRCQKCGSESSCQATFYELDINICGHKLFKCLTSRFSKGEEKLEGENQYMCDTCSSKQNAVRSIRLQTLPPVLNLQLLRFVFDVKKGQKKKLNTYVQFGDILDMSRYLDQPDLPDNSSEKTEKAPRGGKGLYSSRNAYMLVYRLIEEKIEAVMHYIERDNAMFEDWIQDIVLTRDANIFSGKEQQLRVRELYSGLIRQLPDEPFEWFPIDWITKWLTDPEKATQIDCSQYLCPHQCLHPDMVSRMKAVSVDGASELYKIFGGGPRLNGIGAMCEECVRLRCKELKFRHMVAEDGKFLNTALRQVTQSPTMYWVGKASLRSWKRHALAKLDVPYSVVDTSSNNNVLENGEKEEERHVDCDQETGQEDRNGGDNGMSDGALDDADLSGAFNSEIVCKEHGELIPDENCRRLVTDAAWSRLCSYFPDCPQFDHSSPVCTHCLEKIEEEKEHHDVTRQLYSRQKSDLHMLYLGRNRPKPPNLNGQQVFVVSAEFIEDWRKFVRTRDTMRKGPLEEICNTKLLCDHKKLLFPVEEAEYNTENGLVLLWEEEWRTLTEHYRYDIAIEVMSVEEENGNRSTITIPETCDQCVAQRLQMEEEQKFSFDQATIFVRKVLPDAVSSLNSLDSESTKDDDDPDFQESAQVKPSSDGEPSLAKRQKLEDSALRKSQRHRKQRGEKEVRISSAMTLKEFKIKVMNQFSIPTFDQVLTLDGRTITDNEATLGQLRFYPGCLVLVTADQPSQDTSSVIDDILSARRPEEGFKGTNLLSR
ncbi:hypothetical protein C0Q70_03716 [Pomacea canaliculata]|uniref:ubiquitinyl hydrolase 1 n=1 Tax=Pomacea canaliculata TaxID=400727 RepID=A0A2T7PTI9_POMCA|nr:hypothetical protein C0Q70_03716 [Pomacea canaliculata]